MTDRTPIEGLEWILKDDRFGFGNGLTDPCDDYEQAGVYIRQAIKALEQNRIDTREEPHQIEVSEDGLPY